MEPSERDVRVLLAARATSAPPPPPSTSSLPSQRIQRLLVGLDGRRTQLVDASHVHTAAIEVARQPCAA
eukprot:156403-Hanusia_phi.AAC.1